MLVIGISEMIDRLGMNLGVGWILRSASINLYIQLDRRKKEHKLNRNTFLEKIVQELPLIRYM